MRKKAHADSGLLTLLVSEDWWGPGSGWRPGDGGLQLLNSEGRWVEVAVPQGGRHLQGTRGWDEPAADAQPWGLGGDDCALPDKASHQKPLPAKQSNTTPCGCRNAAGALLLNLGSLLTRITNGAWKSTLPPRDQPAATGPRRLERPRRWGAAGGRAAAQPAAASPAAALPRPAAPERCPLPQAGLRPDHRRGTHLPRTGVGAPLRGGARGGPDAGGPAPQVRAPPAGGGEPALPRGDGADARSCGLSARAAAGPGGAAAGWRARRRGRAPFRR